jgi:hypothetical protein
MHLRRCYGIGWQRCVRSHRPQGSEIACRRRRSVVSRRQRVQREETCPQCAPRDGEPDRTGVPPPARWQPVTSHARRLVRYPARRNPTSLVTSYAA